MYGKLNTKEAREKARAALLEGYEVTTYPDADCTVGTAYMRDWRSPFALKIFDGTAGKPSVYKAFTSPERRQAAIERHLESRRKSLAYKKQRKAEQKGYVTGAAATAAAIRARLKKEFPGVKFSVTSETYSLGDSVSVHWTDGPVCSLVEPILEEYQHGYFDGMTDSYEYRSINPALGCPGAKYVHPQREQSPERKAELRRMWDEGVRNSEHVYNGQIMDRSGELNTWYYENVTPETWAPEYRKIHEAREAAKAEQRVKEEEERQTQLAAERRDIEKRVAEDRKVIADITAFEPLKDGAPYVVINYSESPSLKDGEVFSVGAADKIFRYLDNRQVERKKAEGQIGYDKIGFTIHYVRDDEPGEYTGRYDLGDGDEGMLEHMRNWGRYYAKNSKTEDGKAEALEVIALADRLQEQTAGGRIIVQIAPWVEEAKKRREQRAKEEWDQLVNFARTLPIDVLEEMARSSINKPNGKDVAAFFVAAIYERDKLAGMKLGRELGLYS